MVDLEHLNERFRAEFPYEEQHPLGLRMRRILSWYERALREDDDPDTQFILCWIAYNSAYGIDDSELIKQGQERVHDLQRQKEFFEKLVPLDRHRRLRSVLEEEVYGAFQTILENEFIYRAFWLYEKGEMRFENWLDTLDAQQVRVARAYREGDVGYILNTLFERLYVLRNQLLHGGATYQSKVNRSQVENGAKVMLCVVPHIAELMMDGSNIDWGVATFPVIDTN